MSNQLIPSIQLLIAFQCLFFVGFLATGQRWRPVANRILATLLILLCIHMTLNLVNTSSSSAFLLSVGNSLGFCYGPVLYLYARCLAFQNYRLTSRTLSHCLVPIAVFGVSSIIHVAELVLAAGIFTSLAVYGYATWQLLTKYRAILSQTRSEFDTIALRWLSNLLLLQVGLLTVNIISAALHMTGHKTVGFWAEALLFAGLLLLVNLIVFNGLQHPNLFAGVSTEDEAIARALDEGKVGNSAHPIPDSEAKNIFEQIEQHMSEKQAFLNPNLTVKMLARQLLIPARTVSQVINQVTQQNFSEYVNKRRISYAQSLLRDPNDNSLSIMDVMLQSGFNTKSNFNRSFKATTHMTPAAYRAHLTVPPE